jgi:hypothetical protein
LVKNTDALQDSINYRKNLKAYQDEVNRLITDEHMDASKAISQAYGIYGPGMGTKGASPLSAIIRGGYAEDIAGLRTKAMLEAKEAQNKTRIDIENIRQNAITKRPTEIAKNIADLQEQLRNSGDPEERARLQDTINALAPIQKQKELEEKSKEAAQKADLADRKLAEQAREFNQKELDRKISGAKLDAATKLKVNILRSEILDADKEVKKARDAIPQSQWAKMGKERVEELSPKELKLREAMRKRRYKMEQVEALLQARPEASNAQPGQIVYQKGKAYKLKEGGDPNNPDDYEEQK